MLGSSLKTIACVERRRVPPELPRDKSNNCTFCFRVKKPIKIKKRFTKTILKSHQLKKRFNFTCELCNKKFGFRERFEAHMLEHEGKSVSINHIMKNKASVVTIKPYT